jgi:hypothetical protein
LRPLPLPKIVASFRQLLSPDSLITFPRSLSPNPRLVQIDSVGVGSFDIGPMHSCSAIMSSSPSSLNASVAVHSLTSLSSLLFENPSRLFFYVDMAHDPRNRISVPLHYTRNASLMQTTVKIFNLHTPLAYNPLIGKDVTPLTEVPISVVFLPLIFRLLLQAPQCIDDSLVGIVNKILKVDLLYSFII